MRKLFSLFAALALSVGLWAINNVPYIDANGVEQKRDGVTGVISSTDPVTLNAGWYVVMPGGGEKQTGTLVCQGEVHLIVCDGAKLTATGADNEPGIKVSGEGNSLTIYAQSTGEQSGQLIAIGGVNAAGIGGEVYGSGSNITINGGIVTATGGWGASGIGSGNCGSGSNITINGGEVTAIGGGNGAGIGGGRNGSGSYITISGGTVTATGGDMAAGIGGGEAGFALNISVATSLVVKADGNNPPTTVIAATRTATTDIANDLAGKRYATIEPVLPISTSYIDENSETQTVDAWEVKDASEAVTWGTAGNTTWYIVKGTDVQLSKGAVCAGDVRLILADGAKLTATGESWQSGIKVSGDGNSLTIYGQTAQSGQLIAKGGSSGAGIGGGYKQDGSNIIINGGIVTATGGGEASGIGGGSSYNSSTTIQGSNITINAGTVTATGGLYAAGIGGGNRGSGSNITINGGIVKATGANSGSGIGGGNQGHGSNIIINGGTVEATGGSSGAGIGGGYKGGKGFDITINGGVVTANGGNHAAGIGGGNMGIGYNITISGGTVTAIGGTDIAGIGIGESATVAASNIYISDAYILKAGAEADPTAVIEHSSATDLASTLTQRYVQFGGLATPYTRTVTANSWGTVCLPYAVTGFSGVTFYKVNYYNASEEALYLEEVTALEAGKPYIFEATEDGTLTINHSATAPMAYSAVGNEGGLYGSFARTTLAYDADHAYAAISGGSVVIVGEGNTVTVPACRAYLDMNEVATSKQGNAPLRKLGAPRGQATNNENVNADGNMNGKFIINGQFVIVKDGKKINALGF